MHSQVVVGFLLASLAFCATIKSYDGFKVYKVLAKNDEHNEYLRKFESNPDFDFWTKINKRGRPVSIMVSPKSQDLFESFLKANKIDFDIQIQNVESFNQENKKKFRSSKKPIEDEGITFDRFYRHAEINAYLDYLAKNYPDTTTVKTIGQSFEKRDMNIIKISSGVRDPPKPVIFIDAGIHAREWIASPAALYAINQLVENPENSNLLEDVDWIILPSLNPDGYEYSIDVERYWRKTVSTGERCNGADANRNFDFHWMESGADSAECSDVYAGKEPFSEVETQHLRDFILNGTENIKAYLTLHSVGPEFLFPWGYDETYCDNWEELYKLGEAMSAAIAAAGGEEYFVGGAGRDLYPAAGGSDDWSMGVAGIDIVYTMELSAGYEWGFDLPEELIQGFVEKTFEGFKVLGDYVAKNRQ